MVSLGRYIGGFSADEILFRSWSEDVAEDIEGERKYASWHRDHPDLHCLVRHKACADQDYDRDEHQGAVEGGAYSVPDLGPWIFSQWSECLRNALPEHNQEHRIVECCWND